MTTYRIHGDNIVECERIAGIIQSTVEIKKCHSLLASPSTVTIILQGEYLGEIIDWRLELLPGFNKNTKKRWSGNIFDSLKEAGSFFDETPDAIISIIEDKVERILVGIEFCSALQAGNQAWQRSARAYSTGRTGCPYLYIVDFVKYELDNETRARKNLRFPNAAVPYSYVNYSKTTGNFVAQLYSKSEEFDRTCDTDIVAFDESDFGSTELGNYIVKLMLGKDTSEEETTILKKNMNVVQFLANHFDSDTNFTAAEWKEIYDLTTDTIIDFSVDNKRFGFHKTIAAKSQHGKTAELITLVDSLGVGLASRDLPFGIIPASSRLIFAKKLADLYPSAEKSVINAIGQGDNHLVIAIFKGFKPRGDDNRPDRGLLPLASMLSAADVDILSFIYGPVIEANLRLLDEDPFELAKRNGLWRSILALSNYLVLDVPILAKKQYDTNRVYDTRKIKDHYLKTNKKEHLEPKPAFSSVPVNLGEDDVDTGIHYLFTHILNQHCFEGMCNPPGGDWSGFSVIDGDYENRWLSLPRESDIVGGKRPDHIVEIFGVFNYPVLLSIESKEKSADLELDVGTKLVTYIEQLMRFIPSATRKIKPKIETWRWGKDKVQFSHFETISAAAYLKRFAEAPDVVFKKNCEMLFVLDPFMSTEKSGWKIEIIASSKRTEKLKDFILRAYGASGNNEFVFI